jgi:predicted DNA-binding transcriptional regulator YafY
VRARAWHKSQRIAPGADGSVQLTLDVCLDRALRSWILSFGPFARVLEPASLAGDVAGELEQARARYA